MEVVLSKAESRWHAKGFGTFVLRVANPRVRIAL
jgi:hypothetical protein